jgi:hypothetical protein
MSHPRVTPPLQNVRSGNYGVVAANHTLILNWNDQTVPLLRQIALNRTERADDTYDGCAAQTFPTYLATSIEFDRRPFEFEPADFAGEITCMLDPETSGEVSGGNEDDNRSTR